MHILIDLDRRYHDKYFEKKVNRPSSSGDIEHTSFLQKGEYLRNYSSDSTRKQYTSVVSYDLQSYQISTSYLQVSGTYRVHNIFSTKMINVDYY